MLQSPTETRASLILRLPNAADVAAWDEVMEVYGPLVYRLAIHRGLQPADAEDLAQEVFASIADSIGDWLKRDDRGGFRAWLVTITRNLSINFLTRARYRTLATGGPEGNARLAQLPANVDELNSLFDLELRRELLQWAAEQVQQSVSESTWQAFRLTHLEGVSIAEASKQLGISAGNIYIARSRVMARLRELISEFNK